MHLSRLPYDKCGYCAEKLISAITYSIFFYYADFHETHHRLIDFCGHLLQRNLHKRGEKCRNRVKLHLLPCARIAFSALIFTKLTIVQWRDAELFCFKFYLRQSKNTENMQVN